MSFTIPKTEIIQYPPKVLNTYEASMYEYIDNLHFTLDPKECLDNAEEYIAIVTKRFLKIGWHGDGEIRLMWVPPFMLNEKFQWDHQYNTVGVTIWHVKQIEDGLSWMLYPKGLMQPYTAMVV